MQLAPPCLHHGGDTCDALSWSLCLYNPMTEGMHCRQMLDYTKGSVTRNASEKKINSLLDFVSTSTDMKLLQV